MYNRFTTINSRAYYEELLKKATSYEEWSEAATALDGIDGIIFFFVKKKRWAGIMELKRLELCRT